MAPSAHTVMIRGSSASKFAGLNDVQELDVDLARRFWRAVERVAAGAQIWGSTEGRQRLIVLVSGWLAETRNLPDGRRQIFSLLLPGDVASIGGSTGLNRGLVALTNVELADVGALGAAAAAGEGKESWLAESIRRREERLFDQIVRIGRLSAKERVLHFLLELYHRLDAIGLVKEDTFRIPLTQELFADVLGLSVVHINRTLQQLRREGLLTIGRGAVTLHQPHKLASTACYQFESPFGEARSWRPVTRRNAI
jgi:CRP-like cAMP-binding protein